MDLRLIDYFVATADHGSATAAAAALHLTQPSLSRQLRHLERQLGVTLFDRDERRLVLSRAGEQLLPLARELLTRADAFVTAGADLAAGRLQQVHLAVPTTTFTDVVAPFLATLGDDDPVAVVRELDPRGAEAAIASGADLAIVGNPPGRQVRSLSLARLPIWAYVRPDDEWSGRASVGLADLVARPLVLMSEQFRPRVLLDAAVSGAGLAYTEVVECGNAQIAQALAAAGRGVAVVSDDPRFDLVAVRVEAPEGDLRLRLYAAWDPRHHAAEALATLAGRIAAFCAERYGAVGAV
ncbi:LysR family transcriptional regulator [Nocardioides sp. Kera G14]|uniref:LysR family transcriptional regulator n=1 Tax=Nocardioides sp. Kera G14 TaxID=2884264 RepID=UPI001D10BCE8|nr:LysR family transcriptional regulator [Nocardioides sp. Kera G14]UDY25417.1 LysR family transcriptional regulator [Nocardioides sp. Kera G14]